MKPLLRTFYFITGLLLVLLPLLKGKLWEINNTLIFLGVIPQFVTFIYFLFGFIYLLCAFGIVRENRNINNAVFFNFVLLSFALCGYALLKFSRNDAGGFGLLVIALLPVTISFLLVLVFMARGLTGIIKEKFSNKINSNTNI